MYEKFSRLLQDYNVTAYKVSKETGISQQTLSDWKNGKSQPKTDKLQKIADYFGVPLTYFTGDGNAENDPVYLDDETRELIDTLRKRPEMRTLFKVSQNASKEDVEMAVDIIEKFKKGSGNYD